MTDPKDTETDAPQDLIGEPGGRAKVWLWVVVGLALLAAVFIVRRQEDPDLTPVVVTAPDTAPANGAIETAPLETR